MTIDNKTVVSVTYSLSVKNENHPQEKQFEKAPKENPFVFIYGSGSLLPDFEKNLKGKRVGDPFDFQISAEKGYGIFNENYLINIPTDSFKQPDGSINLNELKIGNTLPMTDNQGNRLQGKIVEITATHVKMDFNHELAGMDLHFVGEVVNVRSASAEELDHGHVHGPCGHHH